jgi:hypothetical protein
MKRVHERLGRRPHGRSSGQPTYFIVALLLTAPPAVIALGLAWWREPPERRGSWGARLRHGACLPLLLTVMVEVARSWPGWASHRRRARPQPR